MSITKYVLPVIVGAMSGMILITTGQWAIQNMYPLPSGTDLYDADSVAKYMRLLPTQAYVFIIINYILCSFLAGIISSLVAKRESSKPALVVGIVLTLAGLYNIVNIPQPAWVSIISTLAYIPFAYSGYFVVKKRA